jgi:hypothetical protein
MVALLGVIRAFVVQKTVANHESFEVNRAAMRLAILVATVLVVASCVDVPDSVRAEFAGASPEERSNFRRGRHGSAPPSAASSEAVTDAGAAEGPDGAAP